MTCDWKTYDQPDANGRCRMVCLHCGYITKSRINSRGVRVVKSCVGTGNIQPAYHGPCSHIGDETRREECPSCSGKVMVKIFACTIHGECTAGKQLDGVACCVGCKDWRGATISKGN